MYSIVLINLDEFPIPIYPVDHDAILTTLIHVLFSMVKAVKGTEKSLLTTAKDEVLSLYKDPNRRWSLDIKKRC